MRKFYLLIFLLAAVWALTSCNPSADLTDAQNAVNQYLQLIKNKDYEKALEFYDLDVSSDLDIKPETNQADWLRSFSDADAKLGTLLSYEQVGWRIQTGCYGHSKGVCVILNYVLHRSKYNSRNTITLVRSTKTGTMKVLQDQVTSVGVPIDSLK
ncbi:hypothetical protein ANRL3_00935 [Anaerolineae bacterium]|nr:hypothetical protein ANRL3_00935 [Anaerolineae bacterium]